jgi:N-formylglutamate deformylase
MTEPTHTFHAGSTPLVISLPHVGEDIPDDLHADYIDRTLQLEDTDWHLERLYAFAKELGASVIAAHVSRYVIDLNRPPDNTPMYPGASNTELCPTRFFNGDVLYRDGCAPGAAEVQRRLQRYWCPYHDQLQSALEGARNEFGYALLWDGHSIRSEIPWLFDGRLPDLNLGTAGGGSCHESLRETLHETLLASARYTYAIDGRFKGGYITRHYGRPLQNIHAVQLEMCQSLYMQETLPFAYDEVRAAQVQPILRSMIERICNWSPDER